MQAPLPDQRPQHPPRDKPRVAVLMACLNGERWIEDQVNSILAQLDVAVELFIFDDGSSDRTGERVAALATRDARVHWRRNPSPKGYAAANFFHAIRSVDGSLFDLIAFADQDDIWLPGKLALQIHQLSAHGADGVSSDVIAIWSTGRAAYLRKSYPQRRYDHVFESPGPGCSMVVTPRLYARVRELLVDPRSAAATAGFHDWLIYAVARGSGWAWHIGAEPTMLYRQHALNELGMNRGLRAWLRRAARYGSGRFRRDCCAMLKVAAECAERSGLCRVVELSALDILLQGRRRPLHRVLMAAMFPLGLSAGQSPLRRSDSLT